MAELLTPDERTLRLFLLGRLAGPDAERVERYLESHPDAADTLENLAAEDTFTSALRGQRAGDVNPEVQAAMDRFEGLVRGGPGQTTAATSADDSRSERAAIGEDTQDTLAFLSPARQPGELGRLGGYRVLRLLGAGGMGLVLDAEDPQLGRHVALKVMRPRVADNPKAKERFLREARAAAKVEHDHVVPVYFVGEDNGVPYIVMPFLRGESLDARLKREGRLPAPEVVRIGREAAEGLAAAHDLGLIHRDVKPANLWLEAPRGRVKVLDFGLARLNSEAGQLTQSGAIVGTPAYMAPEQARGPGVDARSDLFSLGAVLYRMATGRTPFSGTDTMSILMSLAADTPEHPRRLNPELPPHLADLIVRLLAKDPAQRPQSAGEVIALLAPPTVEALSGDSGERRAEFEFEADDTQVEVPMAAPAGRPGLPFRARPAKRQAGPGLWVGLTAALVLLIGGGLAAYKLVFETKDGKLLVEVDRDADVRFKDGKLQIYDEAGNLQYTLEPNEANKSLPPGKYTIKVSGVDGLKVNTPEFRLEKGGKTKVYVMVDRGWRPAGGAKKDARLTDKRAGSPAPGPVENAAVPDPGGPPAGPSPFDALDPAAIPKEERFAWQPKELVAVVGSHRGMVTPGSEKTIEISPDGRWIVWTSNGSGAWLLDAATLAVRFRDPTPYQSARAFSPDSKWLALASDPGPDDPKGGWGIRLVDLTGPEPRAVKYLAIRNENGISAVAFLADGKTLVTGTAAGGIHLWDITGPGAEPTRVVRALDLANQIYINQIAVSADGSKLLAAEGGEGRDTLRGYDLRAAGSKVLFTLPVTYKQLRRFGLSADGKTLVVPGEDSDGKWATTIWDVSGPEPKVAHTPPWGAGGFKAFAPGGKSVLIIDPWSGTGGEWSFADGLPKVRDLPKGAVAVSPDGRRVVQIDSGRLRVLDADGKPVGDLPPAAPADARSPFAHLCVPAAAGDKLVTFGDNTVWSVRGGAFTATRQDAGLFPGTGWDARTMSMTEVSPDGKSVAGLGWGGVRVFAVDGTTLRPRATLPTSEDHPANTIVAFAWQPDGGAIVTLQRDGSFRRWPLVGEKPDWQPFLEPGEPDNDARLVYAPDGKRLAVRSKAGVAVWDLSGPKPAARKLAGPPDSKPTCIAFSPDGRGLFVAYDTKQIARFDMTRPDDPGRIFLTKDTGPWVSPSPGGGRLAVWYCLSWSGRVWCGVNVWDFAARAWVASIPLPDPIWHPSQVSGDVPVRWADAGRHLIVPQFGVVYVLRLPAPDPDRRAAECLLKIDGAAVKVRTGLKTSDYIRKPTDLPAGPFALTEASLWVHRLTDADLDPIRGLAGLEILGLQETNITDAGLAKLKDLTGLRHLALDRTRITDAGLAHVNGLSRLEAIGLQGTRVTDAGLEYLRFLPNLAWLALDATEVGDAGLERLQSLTSLRTCQVPKTRVTEAGVRKLAAALPACKIEWNGGTVEPKEAGKK